MVENQTFLLLHLFFSPLFRCGSESKVAACVGCDLYQTRRTRVPRVGFTTILVNLDNGNDVVKAVREL